MSSSRISLIITCGDLKDNEYVFEEPALCIIGRAENCTIQLPTDPGHLDVSRHHCLLEIAPPRLRVRDLGSRNGTFVNGQKIGERPERDLPPESWDNLPPKELKEGDEVRIGHNIIRVAEVES